MATEEGAEMGGVKNLIAKWGVAREWAAAWRENGDEARARRIESVRGIRFENPKTGRLDGFLQTEQVARSAQISDLDALTEYDRRALVDVMAREPAALVDGVVVRVVELG